MPPPRVLFLAVVGIAALVALVSVLEGGGDATPAPIRAADPAPPIVVEPPTPLRRRKPRSAPDPVLERQPDGQLEQREPEPKASGPAQEQAAPEAPAPAPVEESPSATEPAPAPATSAPTPPAVEFGL